MDRLLAIVIALQNGPRTAQSLADHLEVSRRTILRDMQTLAEIGVPIYAEAGPGGGFRLMERFRLPPLQFHAQEAMAVLFALESLAKLADTPFSEARWTATEKIKAIMPEETLRQMEPLLERGELKIPQRTVKTPHLPALFEYTAESVPIRVLYRSETRRRWLRLHPERIYTAHGFWYCAAYSETHGEARTFRVDRMERVEAMDDGELRPP